MRPAVATSSGPLAPAAPGRATLSADLDGVVVIGEAYSRARAAFLEANDLLVAAHAALVLAENELSFLTSLDATLTATMVQRTAAKKQATVELAVLRKNLQAIAVTSYVRGTDADQDRRIGAQDLSAMLDLNADRMLFDSVRIDQERRTNAAADKLQRAVTDLNEAVGQREGVRVRTTVVTAARDQAAADEASLRRQLLRRGDELQRVRATSVVSGADFTLVAMDAFWQAAKVLAEARSQCGIEWWVLAGISRIESRHGTFAGSELLANGDTSVNIIGIALNGTQETALIGDSDGGALDGDAEYDRAVGPMQFIPTTWSSWGRDGNDDGTEDPNNMYDAALGAGYYLCNSGPLGSPEALTRAFLRYNNSDEYAATVLEHALAYRQYAIPPPPPPVTAPDGTPLDAMRAAAATPPALVE
ncbi:MAG: lytic transglycosylase domain-containing protein [Acidimicrobiia bacterium]